MYIGALPTGSNRATYRQNFQLWDSDSDEFIDLTLATIVFELRDPNTKASILSVTNSSGVELVGDGTFEVTLTVTQMRTLNAIEYDVGITIEDEDTIQLVAGTLPVIDGIVT